MQGLNRLLSRQVSLVRVIASLVLVLTGVAVGYDISSTSAQRVDSTIYACVNKWNGATRIVGEGNECGRSEYATSWAEQGPQGPKGDKGDQGPAGKDGEDGEQGPAGTPAGFRVIVQDGRIEHNQTRLFILPCPAGFFPTTGGIVYDVQKYPDFEAHQGSFTYIPASSTYPTAWTQLSRNNSDSQEANVQAWTLCAKIPG